MGSRRSKHKSNQKSRLSARLKKRQEAQARVQQAATPALAHLDLRPVPAPGELVEDLAVFTKSCREQLAADLQAEANAVSEAFDLTVRGEFDAAKERVKNIARGSIYSQWRLFIRGLIAFYHRDIDAARENWSRLDSARRPARIAVTLLQAETGVPEDVQHPRPQPLVTAARDLLNRSELFQEAKRIAAVRHRDPDITFAASQVAMLNEFYERYRPIDSGLVTRFAQACVRLTYFQPNSRVFDLVRKLPGPSHDPHWNLLSVAYYQQFRGSADTVRRHAAAYIQSDLPSLTQLPPQVQNALAAVLYVVQSEAGLFSDMESDYFGFAPPSASSLRRARNCLTLAIKRYPTYRKAHDLLVRFLEMEIESGDRSESAQAALEQEHVAAKEAIAAVFPQDTQTALWLIDHYFETDDLEKIDTLVRQLSNQRLDDPESRALPWKLKLREAMRLSRRKSGLVAAREALDAAESLWPAWLKRDWLPYLHAAIKLRGGDPARFDQLVLEARQACGANDLLHNVMTFSALQLMHLPGAQLKPLRTVIDDQIKQAERQPIDELCRLGSFFWDLVRTGLRHKGYRQQASRLGKSWVQRMERGTRVTDQEALQDTCLWAATHRFWRPTYGPRQPRWLARLSARNPRIALAVLEWLFDFRGADYWIREYSAQVELVEEAFKSENDPFYRFRMGRTLENAREAMAVYNEQRRRYSYDFAWDEDEDQDEEEMECDCPRCRARRARSQSSEPPAPDRRSSSSTNSTRTLFNLDDVDEDEEQEGGRYEEDAIPAAPADRSSGAEQRRDIPVPDPPNRRRETAFAEEFSDDDSMDAQPFASIIYKVFDQLGRERADEFLDLLRILGEEGKGTREAAASMARIERLFESVGLTEEDFTEFMEAGLEGAERMANFRDEFTPPPPPLTPNERRAQNKQRRKQLNQKNRKRR